VQIYLSNEKAAVVRPIRSLVGFERIHLKPGESRVVNFNISPRQLSFVNEKSQRIIEPGYFLLSAGGKQPGFNGRTDVQTSTVVNGRFKLNGKVSRLEL
jgi:beta-glucosidase